MFSFQQKKILQKQKDSLQTKDSMSPLKQKDSSKKIILFKQEDSSKKGFSSNNRILDKKDALQQQKDSIQK